MYTYTFNDHGDKITLQGANIEDALDTLPWESACELQVSGNLIHSTDPRYA